VQQLDQYLTRKRPVAFAVITIAGVAALMLGFALIIFKAYHERAYVFLLLGAASFIGGIAGIVFAQSRLKAALSYGAIALGIMGMLVGFNYLTGSYGPAPNHHRAALVIGLSMVAILIGFAGALMIRPRSGLTALSSAILLGVVASSGVSALIVGAFYLVAFEYSGHAYAILGAGAICLVGGIASVTLIQRKARAVSP
jgi:hypothetical protein